MAYDLTILDGYVHVQFSGQLTVEDLSAVALRLDEIGLNAETAPHRLTDISGVKDLSINFGPMQEFAEKRSAIKPKNPVRFAIVAKSPLQYGCARMFQMLSKQPEIKFAVFCDTDSAQQWILSGKEVADRPL